MRSLSIWGWGRHTVQRYARAERWQDLVKGWPKRRSSIDPFTPYLLQRWDEGYTNILQLHREIAAQGYTGSYSALRDRMRWLAPHPDRRNLPASAAPSVRRATGWITRHPDSLTEEDAAGLKAVLARCPEPEQVHRHTAAFGTMMSNRTGSNLPTWIKAVHGDDRIPHLSRFADGLLADFDAVTAGLTLPYSSGITEGAVNHIKALKRGTFGRDGFPLLHKRILLA
ncbi:hypothetical protein GCM10009839_17570 [Catenulispora yoronensis]|uniref:Transposase IS204/IS1001/IS1096/IS1165 DDE domain-containing protein n=1 Tax=Catenulispora yoronensis TaxID=450799 RepID=A0ABN2TUF1_9ACTN